MLRIPDPSYLSDLVSFRGCYDNVFEVEGAEIKYLARKFGLTITYVDWHVELECKICQDRHRISKTQSIFQCNSRLHDIYYENLEHMNEVDFVTPMTEIERKERDALVKGYIIDP